MAHTGPDTLQHVRKALEMARRALQHFVTGDIEVQHKSGGDPVTAADRVVNEMLRDFLPRAGEGWLSEETTDDLSRLDKERVWVVDPLDGTKEFVARIPEWCVSIALVERGRPIVGGILNPQTDELFLGAANSGVTLNGKPVTISSRTTLAGGLVLASRSEMDRGEWDAFRGARYTIQAMGSVAYKLARVSAGLADATWTLVPKNEWDVAAGVALVLASGGIVYSPEDRPVSFNNESTQLTGLVAHPPLLRKDVEAEFARVRRVDAPGSSRHHQP